MPNQITSEILSPISRVVAELQKVLSQPLVAYGVGILDGNDLSRYASGEATPKPVLDQDLRRLHWVSEL
jgi:hypothetical protein